MNFTSERRIPAPVQRALLTGVAISSAFLSGCVNALRPYNEASQQKMRVQSPTPQDYTVQVGEKAHYSVPHSGRVILDVPRLERGCAIYLFGIVKIKDGSPYDVPAIHVNRDGHTIRKLSLNDLGKLPTDEHDYHLIKIK